MQKYGTPCKSVSNSSPPPVSQSMVGIQDDTIYHMVEQSDGSVVFSDINDETVHCAAHVSEPFLNNLLNIYIGTGVVFNHFERLIESFFPDPNCQILSFNIPDHLQTDMYELYPRIMAVLLNGYTKESLHCTYFVHNLTSPAMPSLFEEPPRLIT